MESLALFNVTVVTTLNVPHSMENASVHLVLQVISVRKVALLELMVKIAHRDAIAKMKLNVILKVVSASVNLDGLV